MIKLCLCLAGVNGYYRYKKHYNNNFVKILVKKLLHILLKIKIYYTMIPVSGERLEPMYQIFIKQIY